MKAAFAETEEEGGKGCGGGDVVGREAHTDTFFSVTEGRRQYAPTPFSLTPPPATRSRPGTVKYRFFFFWIWKEFTLRCGSWGLGSTMGQALELTKKPSVSTLNAGLQQFAE